MQVTVQKSKSSWMTFLIYDMIFCLAEEKLIIKRIWYQGRLHHRRLREQAGGLDVLVEKDCDEGEDPTQEEIEQNLQGPKSVIDKKTD